MNAVTLLREGTEAAAEEGERPSIRPRPKNAGGSARGNSTLRKTNMPLPQLSYRAKTLPVPDSAERPQ